jgi:hypothetical protein
MANKVNTSLKHLQIDRAKTVVIVSVAIAAFVLVFTGFATSSLLNLRNYQARVIEKKEQTRDQLEDNLQAAEDLQQSYLQFNEAPINVIGGDREGDGENDGSNARIVLDSLPSSYDFPALMTSVERILEVSNVDITSITGTDEELAQRDSDSPEPIEMPFSFDINTSYSGLNSLVEVFERSVRPFFIYICRDKG